MELPNMKPSNYSHYASPTISGTMLEQLQPLSKESMAGSMEKVAGKRSTEPAGGLAAAIKIGSSPPSCENKCFGCTPCEPAQVPATSSGRSRLRVQYTNYVPEGWKCKCGPSFYSPWMRDSIDRISPFFPRAYLYFRFRLASVLIFSFATPNQYDLLRWFNIFTLEFHIIKRFIIEIILLI